MAPQTAVTTPLRPEVHAGAASGDDRPGGVRGWWQAGEELRIASSRSPGLWWIRRVNRRVGAFIALALLPTRISPNVVSVAGLLVTAIGGLFVTVNHRSIAPITVLVVFVLWQLAFSLDCADGQLARTRGQSTPFGAWLDQVLDFVSHSIVFTALTVYAVRANELDELIGVALGATVVALSLIQLFASSQRNSLMGTAPALGQGEGGALRWLGLGRHLTDYGAMLAISAILLPWPRVLLWFLIASGVLNGLTVAGQIATNWIAQGRPGGDGTER